MSNYRVPTLVQIESENELDPMVLLIYVFPPFFKEWKGLFVCTSNLTQDRPFILNSNGVFGVQSPDYLPFAHTYKWICRSRPNLYEEYRILKKLPSTSGVYFFVYAGNSIRNTYLSAHLNSSNSRVRNALRFFAVSWIYELEIKKKKPPLDVWMGDYELEIECQCYL